ncbi:MAG: hypothetical protein JSS68_15640 [Actinobacteria bacterium]|nr:hypothetical protein [Actinomycetota bacterium]
MPFPTVTSAWPAALSIAGPKPLNLKSGAWRTVKIRTSNVGGTATNPGTLRAKTLAGVLVKPEKQQLPVLLPGGSYTLGVQVELTKRAKKKSTLSLSASASGANTGTGSVVLKLETER